MAANNPRRGFNHYLGIQLRHRGQEAADRVSALSNAEVAPSYMENETTATREHPGYNPGYLGQYLARHGLWVKTSVSFDPALGSDPDHPGDPQNPLLVIRTLPLEAEGSYSPYSRTTNRWQTWHVSLCFKNDVGAYNDADLGYLVHKFNNKRMHLRFSRISNYITSGELDTDNDPIASDPVVQRVHNAGYYWNTPLHISF